MRTILRCSSIFSSRDNLALIGADAKSLAGAAATGFFSAVAVGFLLTEGRWIGGTGKCLADKGEIKRRLGHRAHSKSDSNLHESQSTPALSSSLLATEPAP